MRPPVTERFAAFVAETDYSNLTPKAVENAKMHILDTLGVALAGYEHPVAKIVLDYCRFTGGAPDVTIWGSQEKTSVPGAAFSNGLLAHAIDYDDWDAIARELQPHFHVMAPDLRGHGDSEWAKGSSYSLTDHVYDLSRLMRFTALQDAASIAGLLITTEAGVAEAPKKKSDAHAGHAHAGMEM